MLSDRASERLMMWPLKKWRELPAAMAREWRWPEYAREVALGRWVFATGGDSHNEAIIDAARQSLAWHRLNVLHLSRGLWVLATTREAADDLGRVEDAIVRWAWGDVRAVKAVRYSPLKRESLSLALPNRSLCRHPRR